MSKVKELEVALFLEALYQVYGVDLKNNSKSSLTRRLNVLVMQQKKESISELIPLLIHKKKFYYEVINAVTVQCSNLFRDPQFFKKMKKKVFTYLQTFPKANIWIAGCANGEEIYSLLILLKEANLLHKVRVYATDLNTHALQIAKSGVLTKKIDSTDIDNYNKSGGMYSLSDYFVTGYGKYKLKDELLSNVVFEEHNLAQDGPFISAEFILCRNVMIYFNKELQERVVKLLDTSLVPNGYLGIGIDESLEFIRTAKHYKKIKDSISIYKKLSN